MFLPAVEGVVIYMYGLMNSGVTWDRKRKLFSGVEFEGTQNETLPRDHIIYVAHGDPFKRKITITVGQVQYALLQGKSFNSVGFNYSFRRRPFSRPFDITLHTIL